MGDQRDFKKFLEAREKAAQSYTTGHAEALVSLCTKESPATFYGPGGGAVVGAHEVSARYEKDAPAFKAGGETHFEVLQSAADDGVGFWTGFQHAKVRMGGNPELVTMKLRVTEVFRREASGWKLVHRHADPMGDAQSPPKK